MEKPKSNYIFPDVLGKAMSKLDLRVQLEASMMSMTLIVIGLILTTIYLIIYSQFVIWYKIVVIINCLAGIVFMSSSLVTTFQQYQNYMQIKQFQNDVKGGNEKK